MTTVGRLRRLRGAAAVLGLAALFLFATAAYSQANPSEGGATNAVSALVPWAVGIIGVLVLYILKLTREIERDFTAVKAAHTTQIEELERGRIRNESRIDGHDLRLAAMPSEIELARQKVAAEVADTMTRQSALFTTQADSLSRRLEFLEQAAMNRQPHQRRESDG